MRGAIYLGDDLVLSVDDHGIISGPTGPDSQGRVGELQWSEPNGAYEVVIRGEKLGYLRPLNEGREGWPVDGEFAGRVRHLLNL